MNKNQSGSTHMIIIAVLASVLIGALGFMFWQNIINKPTEVATANTPSSSVSTTPALKSYCTPLEKLCFDYANNWTYKADKVDGAVDGVSEIITISDADGKTWLRLQAGLDGIGGTCGNDDNSYSKILKTHTTDITGAYLVSDATKDYVVDTVYAINWITYSGANKNWTIDMELNNSKAAPTVGKIDVCDLGLGVFAGKNIKLADSHGAGATSFKYYSNNSTDSTYATEAAAAAALETPEAKKAYAILQSAHYE
jgi:hypothetical protein